MSISWFSVSLLLIVAVIAFIEIFRGIRRGFLPSLLSLGATIPSIMLALLISPGISRGIVTPIFNNFLVPSYLYTYIISWFPSMGPILLAAMQLVGNLLIFLLAFLLCYAGLQLLIHLRIQSAQADTSDDPGYHREKNSFCQRHSTLLGGICGGLCALIISMSITAPFMGAIRVAGDVIDIAEQFEPNLWSMTTLSQEDVDTIKALPKDLPGNVLYELGGKSIFYAAARTQIEGETVFLQEELTHAKAIFQHLPTITMLLNEPANLTSEQLGEMKILQQHFRQLKLCPCVISDYFTACCRAWLNNYIYYGFPRPQVPALTKPLMDDILLACSRGDASTITANISTLLNSYVCILESGLLTTHPTDYPGLLTILENSQMVDQLQTELSSNPSMSHIRVSSIGMKLWPMAMQNQRLTDAKLASLGFYDQVANALNTVHGRGYGSANEKLAVLRTHFDKLVSNFGFFLPKVLSDAITTELMQLSPTENTFTGAQIQEFFQNYS